MGIARNLEKRLERLADGLSAAIFRGRMHPVDLANRLVRQADLMVTDGATGPSIPNHFDVVVGEGDLDPSVNTTQLTTELSHTLTATAEERGWRIGGPIAVRLSTDSAVGRGSIRCDATAVPSTLPPWGELAEHRGDRSFALADNRVVVGRSSEADVTIEEQEISRHHAVLFREGGSAVDCRPQLGQRQLGQRDISGIRPTGDRFRRYAVIRPDHFCAAD